MSIELKPGRNHPEQPPLHFMNEEAVEIGLYTEDLPPRINVAEFVTGRGDLNKWFIAATVQVNRHSITIAGRDHGYEVFNREFEKDGIKASYQAEDGRVEGTIFPSLNE